jgi:hypothetical protein
MYNQGFDFSGFFPNFVGQWKKWTKVEKTDKSGKNGQKWTKGKSIIIFLREFENTTVFQPTNKLLNILLYFTL